MNQTRKNTLITVPSIVLTGQASSAPNLNDLIELIKTYAPIISFHPDERFLPIPVESYLEKTWLVNAVTRDRETVSVEKIFSDERTKETFYLEPMEGVFFSSKLPVKTYVHVREHNEQFIDLQFWFLYGQTAAASA